MRRGGGFSYQSKRNRPLFNAIKQLLKKLFYLSNVFPQICFKHVIFRLAKFVGFHVQCRGSRVNCFPKGFRKRSKVTQKKKLLFIRHKQQTNCGRLSCKSRRGFRYFLCSHLRPVISDVCFKHDVFFIFFKRSGHAVCRTDFPR